LFVEAGNKVRILKGWKEITDQTASAKEKRRYSVAPKKKQEKKELISNHNGYAKKVAIIVDIKRRQLK